MKVFFSENMVADICRYTSPSSIKPRDVAAALEAIDLPVVVVEPEPVSDFDLCEAHAPRFI